MLKLDDLKSCGGYVYLATPYSKYPAGIGQAWIDACILTGRLIQRGVPVYSPIAHTHPIAKFGKMDAFDHAIWLPADRPMMAQAAVLLVARMDGWAESYGIAEEIKCFTAARKPIFHLDPKTLDIIMPEVVHLREVRA